MKELELICGWKSRATPVVGAHACNASPGHIVVTTIDQVIVCNTTTTTANLAEQVQGWDFRPDSAQSISIATVKHASKDIFYAIRGKSKKDLITWSSATEKLTTLVPHRVPVSVSHLLVHAQIDGCLIIGNDGSVHIFTNSLNHPLETVTQASHEVVWANVQTTPGHPLHLAVVTQHLSSFELIVYNINDVSKLSLSHRQSFSAPSPEASLVSCVFHATASISLLWSTGLWQTASLFTLGVKDMSILSLYQNKNDDAGNHKKRKVTSVTYHSCEVAVNVIAIASSSQLCLWHSSYGIMMSQFSYDMKAHGTLLDIFVLPDAHVVFVCERAVWYAAVPAPPSTLASVLGKGNHHHSECIPAVVLSTVVPPQEVHLVLPQLDVSTWASTMLRGNDEQRQVLRQLTDARCTPTKESFAKVFNGYVYFKTRKKIRTAVLSPQFVHQVTRRCVESPELGLWSELSLLIRTKHLCSRTVPSLIPTILAHKQFGLLDICLTHLSDIDEFMCIRVCKFILRRASTPAAVERFRMQQQRQKKLTNGKDDGDDDADDNNNMEVRSNASSRIASPAALVEYFLSQLVCLPKTDVFLQNAMQALQLVDVVTLLVCLNKWFVKKIETEDDRTMLRSVIEWVSLLLDVHFTALVLASSEHPKIENILKDASTLLGYHLDACKHMADVHGELDQLLLSGTNTLPQTSAVPEYSVETVML